VLQVSKSLGYRPNLAARFLSQRKQFRISVNTLSGTTSFWDEVRDGINHGARALGVENVELDFRTYPLLGEAEEEAFLSATKGGYRSFRSTRWPAGRWPPISSGNSRAARAKSRRR
jgi:hypothetical protein